MDGGDRWKRRHGHLMQPWRDALPGYVLIIGQVDGDAALRGMAVAAWVDEVCRELTALGETDLRFRAHPFGLHHHPRLARRTRGTLEEDLAGARRCVTFNSTAGVEAVLAGVPTVTLDEGAMAWPVAAHTLVEVDARVNREPWAFDLAWTQWTIAEIASGDAWEHLAPLREAA